MRRICFLWFFLIFIGLQSDSVESDGLFDMRSAITDVRQVIRMSKVIRLETREEPERFFDLEEENAASHRRCGRGSLEKLPLVESHQT